MLLQKKLPFTVWLYAEKVDKGSRLGNYLPCSESVLVNPEDVGERGNNIKRQQS